jgi:hypothetical protein
MPCTLTFIQHPDAGYELPIPRLHLPGTLFLAPTHSPQSDAFPQFTKCTRSRTRRCLGGTIRGSWSPQLSPLTAPAYSTLATRAYLAAGRSPELLSEKQGVIRPVRARIEHYSTIRVTSWQLDRSSKCTPHVCRLASLPDSRLDCEKTDTRSRCSYGLASWYWNPLRYARIPCGAPQAWAL